MGVARRFREFVEREVRDYAPVYRGWALALADDPAAVALIEALPPDKRQPNLVLAAARFHGADGVAAVDFPTWLRANWAAVRETVSRRRTQTNEAGRAAVLVPAFGLFPGPLTLIEVGASAGLCLYPDRFGYRYARGHRLDPADGPSEVLLECADTGPVPHPARLPSVAHRAGVDLAPLDPADPEDRRWLETLVWPGQTARLERLRGALDIAARDPATVLAGDLNTLVADLVHAAPADTTVVVFHSAVLGYLTPPERERFRRIVSELPCHWIANEAPAVFPEFLGKLPGSATAPATDFLLTVDGTPLARTGPHGQSLHWFDRSGGRDALSSP
ncbi:DUF2332 domain-containing protein [Nocardia takedensis]